MRPNTHCFLKNLNYPTFHARFFIFAVLSIESMNLKAMVMKVKVIAMLLVATVGLLTSCSKDNDTKDPVICPVVLPDDNDIIERDPTPVSLALFNQYTIGYGWCEAETHEMNNDGTYQKQNYWEDMDGGGPERYEFSEGVVTCYIYVDALPADGFYKRSLRYDETTGEVFFDENKVFTVLSANEQEIRVVKLGGLRGDNHGGMKQIFLYVVLRRMTDEQLQETRDIYTTNLDEIRP